MRQHKESDVTGVRRACKTLAGFMVITCLWVPVGCAAGPKADPLTPQERASVRSVSVSPEVDGRDRAIYVTREARMMGNSAVFGLVGGARLGEFGQRVGCRLQADASGEPGGRRRHADPGVPFPTGCRRGVPAPRDTTADPSQADAQFTLGFVYYGLSGAPKRKGLRPFVDVRARLVRRSDGAVLWEQPAHAWAPSSELSSYGYKDYKRDPAPLRPGFESAISLAVAEVIGKLR